MFMDHCSYFLRLLIQNTKVPGTCNNIHFLKSHSYWYQENQSKLQGPEPSRRASGSLFQQTLDIQLLIIFLIMTLMSMRSAIMAYFLILISIISASLFLVSLSKGIINLIRVFKEKAFDYLLIFLSYFLLIMFSVYSYFLLL